MKVQPINMFPKDNAIPHRVSGPRPLPQRFKEAAQAEIDKFLASGVLTKCDEATYLCAPGFFVPKGDGKCVKLFTDHTKLNVVCPIHHFPFVSEIVQAISASSQMISIVIDKRN